MSVLLPKPTDPVTPAQKAAALIKRKARVLFHTVKQAYEGNAKDFWQNREASPQEIAEALGPDGAELFALHGRLGRLLEELVPGSTAEGMKVVGQFHINDDGTVEVPVREVKH